MHYLGTRGEVEKGDREGEREGGPPRGIQSGQPDPFPPPPLGRAGVQTKRSGENTSKRKRGEPEDKGGGEGRFPSLHVMAVARAATDTAALHSLSQFKLLYKFSLISWFSSLQARSKLDIFEPDSLPLGPDRDQPSRGGKTEEEGEEESLLEFPSALARSPGQIRLLTSLIRAQRRRPRHE